MASRAHFSSTTLADAAGGERLPSLEVTLAYVAACSGDPATWEERWRATTAQLTDAGLEQPAPYMGLSAFHMEDADRFFGRERLVDEVVGQVTRRPFVVVFGASGSGKSSLLRAGLVPAITKGRNQWCPIVMTPTDQPLYELADRAAKLSDARADDLYTELAASGEGGLDIAVRQALVHWPDDARALLVVDQFEEVFTLCTDDAERQRFIDLLLDAAEGPGRRTHVVLGVRADFFPHCSRHPRLAAALSEDTQVVVGPMMRDELRRAIIEPAASVGVTVAPELISTLTADGADEPGALPLVSYALLETWRRRRDDVLTLDDYQASGGIRGAVAESAEHLYRDLDPGQQSLIRQIFLRMTALGEGTEDTRRRVRRDELDGLDNPATVELVLQRLAAVRLIVIGEDAVEVAHEAVIRSWPRLHRWLTDDRDGLRVHRQLTEAAQMWESLDRDAGALYRGARLAITRTWVDGHDSELTTLERVFVEASEELQESERLAAQRQTRLLQRLVAGLAVLLLIAVTGGAVAIKQRQTAVQQHRVALSRQLAAQAKNLAPTEPTQAMLLSLEAFRIAPTIEARSALLSVPGYPTGRTVLTGHNGQVNGVAFSPDGRLLASGALDRTVMLWDVRRHARIAVLSGHTAPIRTVAFSPDGRLLVSAGADNTAIVWDVASRRRLATLLGHRKRIWDVAFSPDGKVLATASEDGTVRLWSLPNGSLLGRLTGHSGSVNSVAFSPDGRRLATAGKGEKVLLWDVTGRDRTGTLTGHTAEVWAVAFSPDGKRLASAGYDNRIIVWDTKRKSRAFELVGHTDTVRDVTFSPDGHLLASASYDQTVAVWDLQRRARLTSFHDHTKGIAAVAFGPDGHTIASAGEDEAIIMRSPVLAPFTGHTDWVSRISFSPDGRSLASASHDTTLNLWDVNTGSAVATFSGHTDSVRAALFTPDGSTLISGSEDHTIGLWDIRRRTRLATLTTADIVEAAAVSPDGSLLATGGVQPVVQLWDLRRRVHLADLKGHSDVLRTVAFSPDGRLLASVGHDRTVIIWDVAVRRRVATLTGHSGSVIASVFSPDGRFLATAGSDRTVKIWNVATRRVYASLSGHSAPVHALAFSPDGRQLASAGQDRTIVLWDIADRQSVATLTGHTDLIDSLAFHPNGHTLASSGADQRIILWDLNTQSAITRICQSAGRSLTPAEWEHNIPHLPYRRACN
jgi:WD40 repeat protein/energy-coupling factor transporter ATP-binding protein EcfA2